jgi:putative ABC transport system permease protein
MRYLEVVSNDTRLSVWLSFGFLLLCLVNTTGLLLAKFSARAPEVGVRRALGASQGAIFRQFLVEAGVVGLAGGIVGLALSLGALALIAQQSKTLSVVAKMDWPMFGLTFLLAIVASLVAGLLPTWRAAQVTPALQLKSQ